MSWTRTLAAAAVIVAAAPALAQFDAQSDGSDGALVVDADVTIDLRNAVTGSWQDPSPTPGAGIYDPSIWAVVFKYSSVDINAGTVTFTNHSSGAPVVWLVQGDVNVALGATVSLNGANGGASTTYAVPGPGGFAGGRSSSNGFGPGGGQYNGFGNGGAGGHTIGGGSRGAAYGNSQVLPLMGGSGGGGTNNSERTGGAGGGAILIASSTQIFVNGVVRCNGGAGVQGTFEDGGGGSAGAIRLISNSVSMSGSERLTVYGGSGVAGGSAGRIRIEGHKLTIDPAAPAPNTFPYYTTALSGPLFQDETTPTLRLVSANGIVVSIDPVAGVQSIEATLRPTATATSVTLGIHAFNVEPGRIVEVRAFQANGSFITVNSTPLEGNVAFSIATAQITLTPGTPADIALKVLP